MKFLKSYPAEFIRRDTNETVTFKTEEAERDFFNNKIPASEVKEWLYLLKPSDIAEDDYILEPGEKKYVPWNDRVFNSEEERAAAWEIEKHRQIIDCS